MPRFLLVVIVNLVAGCAFDARYSEGVPCSDGECPSGLTCHQGACVSMIPIDMPPDMPPEGLPPALNCADPGTISTGGGTVSGTTEGAASKMASMCGGFVNNGPDRVYRINMDGTAMLRVNIDAGARKAYVLASCVPTPPGTPACLGNARASMGNPIVVKPPAGFAYVVVDDELSTGSGPYTLRLEVL